MDFVIVENAELGQRTSVPISALPYIGEGWVPVDGPTLQAGQKLPDPPFDPNEHTVAEVQEYLAYATPEESQRVLELEAAGQNRKSLTG